MPKYIKNSSKAFTFILLSICFNCKNYESNMNQNEPNEYNIIAALNSRYKEKIKPEPTIMIHYKVKDGKVRISNEELNDSFSKMMMLNFNTTQLKSDYQVVKTVYDVSIHELRKHCYSLVENFELMGEYYTANMLKKSIRSRLKLFQELGLKNEQDIINYTCKKMEEYILKGFLCEIKTLCSCTTIFNSIYEMFNREIDFNLLQKLHRNCKIFYKNNDKIKNYEIFKNYTKYFPKGFFELKSNKTELINDFIYYNMIGKIRSYWENKNKNNDEKENEKKNKDFITFLLYSLKSYDKDQKAKSGKKNKRRKNKRNKNKNKNLRQQYLSLCNNNSMRLKLICSANKLFKEKCKIKNNEKINEYYEKLYQFEFFKEMFRFNILNIHLQNGEFDDLLMNWIKKNINSWQDLIINFFFNKSDSSTIKKELSSYLQNYNEKIKEMNIIKIIKVLIKNKPNSIKFYKSIKDSIDTQSQLYKEIELYIQCKNCQHKTIYKENDTMHRILYICKNYEDNSFFDYNKININDEKNNESKSDDFNESDDDYQLDIKEVLKENIVITDYKIDLGKDYSKNFDLLPEYLKKQITASFNNKDLKVKALKLLNILSKIHTNKEFTKEFDKNKQNRFKCYMILNKIYHSLKHSQNHQFAKNKYPTNKTLNSIKKDFMELGIIPPNYK